MTEPQINDIKTRLNNIKNLDINEVVANIFKGEDLEKVRIGEYSVPDYISTVKRLIRQLEEELNENGFYLPWNYNFQNEFGNGNLQNDIQNFYAHISAKTHNNLNNSVGFLKRLVYYQIVNGFWEKGSQNIDKNAKVLKDIEQVDKLKLIGKHLEKNTQFYKESINELNSQKEDLQSFIKQKNQELQQVQNNLQSSNSNTNQISQLLNTSTSTSEKITSILQQQKSALEAQKISSQKQESFFEDQAKAIKNLKSELETKFSEAKKQVENFNEKLELIESKKDYFDERNNYLDELIGREVGASLFETFKQRKGELESPVNKWLIIVVIMSFVTFGAILAIFTNAFGLLGSRSPDLNTIRLITNSIKTLPFFFLLFYAISQYNKERNFQEEYAFKSAVALTIKAYADIIEREELKDDLIINSVYGIYKSPTIYKTKNKKDENSMIDTAKDLLNTALEVMKKK